MNLQDVQNVQDAQKVQEFKQDEKPHDVQMSLGDRMKSYEILTETTFPNDQPIVIRLDGHCFSTYTKSFDKPFDTNFHKAMIATSKDLLNQFNNATLAFTASDEITLIFPVGLIAFSNRIQKVVSLAAGLASARFNFHIAQITGDTFNSKKLGKAFFDARIFPVANQSELLNCLLWRCRVDVMRNSKSMFASHYISDKKLHKLNGNQKIELVKNLHNVSYEDVVPNWAKHGTVVKKKLSTLLNDDECSYVRTKILESDDICLNTFNDENLSIVVSKFWNDDYQPHHTLN